MLDTIFKEIGILIYQQTKKKKIKLSENYPLIKKY